jgi:hypothetical protein
MAHGLKCNSNNTVVQKGLPHIVMYNAAVYWLWMLTKCFSIIVMLLYQSLYREQECTPILQQLGYILATAGNTCQQPRVLFRV